MVYTLLRLYPDRYPRNRSLPPPPASASGPQETTGQPPSTVLAREINLATACLALSVQTASLLRHAPDHRTLLAKNVGSHLPLGRLQPRPHTKNRAHLPLDAMRHSMLFLLGPNRLAHFPVTSQHLLAGLYREPPEVRTYPRLRPRCRDLLMQEWEARAPDPARYPYPPSLKPHPFMGLNKFDAGRLHQIRSGKSYIRANPSWNNYNPTTCHRCNEFPETSSTPSCLAPQGSLPGTTTFRQSLICAPILLSGPRPPSLAPSPASLGRPGPPSPWSCSPVTPPLLVPLLPARLM